MAATKKQKPQPKPVDALAIFDHAYRIISAEQEMRENKFVKDKEELAPAHGCHHLVT